MKRTLCGFFENEKDILAATRAVRQAGFHIVDVYTPYAVHGLDRTLGLTPSRLPWVGFLLGLAGVSFTVWFEFWTSAVDWPINVGGKPWNSLPAFVPVMFEVMVLSAGIGTVLAFFWVARLRPGKRAILPDPAVTDHRFVMVIDETDAGFEPKAVEQLLVRFNAVQVEEREDTGLEVGS